MPDPVTAPQTATQLAARVNSGEWFQDAPPAAGLNLDELFPNPELASQTPAPAPAAAEPQAPPQPPAPTGPFLRTSTGTVYESLEDTIRGTEEKDRVIARLREQIREVEGRDPLKRNSAPQPVAPQADLFEQLYDEIAAAAEKRDKRGYVEAQAKMMRAVLAPYAPLLADVARERAIREAEAKAPGVREFMGSEAFHRLTERVPLIKEALEQLESNPEAAQAQLGQLMDLARLAGAGLVMPETVRAAAQPAPVQAQTQPRPILQNSTPTPAPASAAPTYRTTEEALRSPEGRKAIQDAYRQRHQGGTDPTLESLGL